MLLHLIRPKGTRKLKRMWTNCQVRLDVVFTITNTPKYTLCFWTWCRPKVYENSQWNANELSSSSKKCTFLPSPTLLNTLYVFGVDAVQKSKSLWKITTECERIVWLIEEAYVFTITNSPRNTSNFWTWCRPKDHENPERNANELSGSSGKRSFLALSTLLETIHHFSLDVVQKTMRSEKYVNELLGSLRKDTFEQNQYP